MARVTHLHAVQPLILENPELAFGAVIAEVGRDSQATNLVHERRDFGKFGQRLLHICRPPAAEVAAKCVRHVFTRPAVDERAGDVRTTQRAPVAADQLRLHVFELDRDAEALQFGHDLFAPPASRGPCIPQEGLETLILSRQKQCEYVQLAPWRAHAELAARNHPHPELVCFMRRVRDAIRRVVIRERDRREIDSARPAGDLRRLAFTVGSRRVAVEINVRRTTPQAQSRPAGTGGTAPAIRGRIAPRTHGRASARRPAKSASPAGAVVSPCPVRR